MKKNEDAFTNNEKRVYLKFGLIKQYTTSGLSILLVLRLPMEEKKKYVYKVSCRKAW